MSQLHQYYKTRFPWALVEQWCAITGVEMVQSRMLLMRKNEVKCSYRNTLRIIKRDMLKMMGQWTAPLALHVFPRRSLMLVFDLDLRAQPNPCPDHERTICMGCWGTATRARDVLRDRVQLPLGLADPLMVYSGGNGVHFWYYIPDDERRYVLGRADARRLLIKSLGDTVVWDADATVLEDGKKSLRCPFSLHESTKNAAVPLPPDLPFPLPMTDASYSRGLDVLRSFTLFISENEARSR